MFTSILGFYLVPSSYSIKCLYTIAKHDKNLGDMDKIKSLELYLQYIRSKRPLI